MLKRIFIYNVSFLNSDCVMKNKRFFLRQNDKTLPLIVKFSGLYLVKHL